jgi:hypothetical protein
VDDEENRENEDTFIRLLSAINMRNKYVFVPGAPTGSGPASASPDDGIAGARAVDSFFAKNIAVITPTTSTDVSSLVRNWLNRKYFICFLAHVHLFTECIQIC